MFEDVPVFVVVIAGVLSSRIYKRARAAEKVRDKWNESIGFDKERLAVVNMYRLKFDAVYASGQRLVDGEVRACSLSW